MGRDTIHPTVALITRTKELIYAAKLQTVRKNQSRGLVTGGERLVRDISSAPFDSTLRTP